MNCSNCVHSRKLDYTHHLACSKLDAQVELNSHGIKHGWCNWPFNFDQIWVETCSSHSTNMDEKVNDSYINHPLFQLLGLLR